MHNLPRIEKVTTGKSGKELRNLYDQVESHVQALHTSGINSGQYGSLLIPYNLGAVTRDIKLEI